MLQMCSNFTPTAKFNYALLHLYPVLPTMEFWLSAAAV